jgi:HEAT repeats
MSKRMTSPLLRLGSLFAVLAIAFAIALATASLMRSQPSAASEVTAADVASAAATSAPFPIAESCTTHDACIVRLRVIAKARKGERFGGMGRAEDLLAERIRSFPGAVDAMVPLLADADIGVAHLAAYVLRDVETIDSHYLPQIEAGLDRDLGWLAPALARIGTDAAAQVAVQRLLVSDSAPENQEAYALKLFGARAVPYIVAAARCEGGCKTKDDHRNLGAVLGEIGADGAQAVPSLLAVAKGPATSDERAIDILSMIGRVGEHARPWQDDIAALSQRKPALAPIVSKILIDIGSDSAGALLAERLRTSPNDIDIRDAAMLGRRGRDTAPALIAILDGNDWELRMLAARALGAIGDAAAAPALTKALNDTRDIRLNWAAAESLGLLRIATSAPALERSAQGHWHPAVRGSAERALRALRDTTASPSDVNDIRDPGYVFNTMGDAAYECEKPDAAIVNEPASRKLYARKHKTKIAKLQYPATTVGYGPPKNTQPNASGIIEVTPETMVRQEITALHTPESALRIDGGWLANSDRGEWGGELMYLGDNGERYVVLDRNIENSFELGGKIVAVVGLAHMMSNDGMLYAIERSATGRWQATPWRALPGAPKASWLTPDGDLLVNTYMGGVVLIDGGGKMRMARCKRMTADVSP